MSMGYVYKMQWLLDATEAMKLIRLLKARSFTAINSRDRYNDLKVTDTFYPLSYSPVEATKKAIKWIRLKNQTDRSLDFELIRK